MARVTGLTRDRDGNLLPSCVCHLFKDNLDNTCTWIEMTTSDAVTARYTFTGAPDILPQYFVVAWKDDSPHRFDVTDHVLVPSDSDAAFDSDGVSDMQMIAVAAANSDFSAASVGDLQMIGLASALAAVSQTGTGDMQMSGAALALAAATMTGTGDMQMVGAGGSLSIEVGVHSKGTGASGTAVSASVTTQATGSTFVVWTTHASLPAVTSITDNFGNSYGTQKGSSIENVEEGNVYVVSNGAGGAGHQVTVVILPATEVTVFFLEIKNAAASSYDSGSFAQASDASSPFTATSGTLAQAINIVVACWASNSGSNPATSSESSGFTIQETETNGASNWTGCIATKVTAATTALTPSFTQLGATEGQVKVFAIKQ